MSSIITKLFLLFALTFCLSSNKVHSMPQSIEYYDAIDVGLDEDLDNKEEEEELDPKIICTMPIVKGFCRGLFVRWAYDPVTRTCVKFNYGGCSGNKNNFLTKKQCYNTCKDV